MGNVTVKCLRMGLILKYKLVFIGAIVGAIAGYLYYFWIGCNTGSCPITSQPVNSTLYGAMMGGLFFSMFTQQNEGEKS